MKTYGQALAGTIYNGQHYPLPHDDGVRRSHRPWCVDCKRTLEPEQLDDAGRCERCSAAAVRRTEGEVRRQERLAREAEQRKVQEPAPPPRKSAQVRTTVRTRKASQPRRSSDVDARRGPRPLIGMQALIQSYKDGDSIPMLAARYGITRYRVGHILDHHGVPRRDDRKTHSGGRNRAKFPAEVVDQVRRLYVDEEMSRPQVAEVVGLTVAQLETLMRNHGIAARQRQSGVGDGAKGLKAQMRDLGVTARDVKAWALGRGLIDDATKPGIPSQRVVDAYAEEHG